MKKIHLKATVLVVLFITTMSVCAQSKRDIKQEAANKKLVMEFYQSLFGDKDFTAIDKYLSKDYIQHNPSVADGSEPLKEGVKIWFKDAPKSKVDFQHTASEGDLVYLHIKSVGADGKITAIMDIFRVKNQKIVEHWDVIQSAPEVSANKHPMF
jgi:predicted SnoaL-like aldol condensation-catalyzing enzyme